MSPSPRIRVRKNVLQVGVRTAVSWTTKRTSLRILPGGFGLPLPSDNAGVSQASDGCHN
jgi:hypothetical protein